ncbi:hypothetical protein BG015_010854 [Linnemannia schmuckeri]|uniref:Uncharacterized protein n=1 Tax=Linnemannia schmuckeri TaxID=64567 RepID=A0A9P5VEG6_9FUNG|nr:hypothetical protein BG015_010854 [Linnemannia schmuckeri]
MAVLPTFISSCIAPDSAGQNAFLFGVPSPGTLEAHLINLSDPLSPTSKLISSTTSSTGTASWDASSSLGCYPYLGDTPSSPASPPPATNATAPAPASAPSFPPPITIVQFGNSVQTQFYPNGTWVTFGTTTEAAASFLTPKMFSPVGSTNGWNWFLARTGGQSKIWRHLRIGSRTEAGSKDLTIAGSEPLLTVGAIAPDANNYGNGLFFHIDQSGSTGSIYRATGNKRPDRNLTATDTLVTLGKPSPLNMNNNTLTVDAVPVTTAFAAFIMDKSDQGVVTVYSIDPRIPTLTLTRTHVKGFSPLFHVTQSFTSLNSRIVVYGGAVSNAIHIFDVISGTWTGPALVDPSAVTAVPPSSGLGMGVIGGIAAAAVVILIVTGMAIWRIRRRRSSSRTTQSKTTVDNIPFNDDIKVPVKEDTIDLLTMDKSRPRFDDRRQTSESTLTPSMAPSSMPGTPVSQHKKRYSNQQRRPGEVSRHTSGYSMRSEGSSSRVSLFPPNSTVYLAGPNTVIPPNPTIPSAFSTANLQKLQNAAAVYRSTSAPGTPNPRSADPPSRKGSMYKFSVPNDYDDRQPLHHHESSEEQQAYLQMSIKSTPDGSPASITGSRPLETASSATLGNSSHGHSHSQSQSRSDTSGSYPRPLFSSSSQPASPKQPRPSTSTIDSEHQSQQSSHQSQQQVNPSSRAASRPRKKRIDGAAPLKSPTSPTFLKESSSTSSQRYADHRDSGSYKVEYRDSSLLQQQQQELQQLQRQYGNSYPASPPTSPASPYTPMSASASSRFAVPSAATKITHLSPSPAPSESDTHFVGDFPMPPKMAATVVKPQKRSDPTPPTSSASRSAAPAPSRPSRQQRQPRHDEPYQQQQYHQMQNQYDDVQSIMGSVGTMSPKTPILVSLPRPIPRERERERERNHGRDHT